MKKLNKARLAIYILGTILIAAVFLLALVSANNHENIKSAPQTPLPQGVHIPININTADKETLCLLDGIGETLAENIIIYRQEHGGFKTKEELTNVDRIGEKTLEKIANYICVE